MQVPVAAPPPGRPRRALHARPPCRSLARGGANLACPGCSRAGSQRLSARRCGEETAGGLREEPPGRGPGRVRGVREARAAHLLARAHGGRG
eukprot:12527499-Alexandrium_andersonii.AAC.1